MEDVLEELELLDYIKGNLANTPADLTMTESQEWQKKQHKTLRVIRLQVNETVANTLAVAETGKQAWDILQARYLPASNYAALTLRRKMYQTFCLEGELVKEFINKFKGWQDEL
jgi:hypothetical protein